MKRTTLLVALAALLALPAAAQNTAVYIEQGGAKLVIGSGGTLQIDDGATVTNAESSTFTLGADEYFKIDAATTAQTQTAGALDLNFAGITASTSGFNLSLTQNNGTSSGANMYAMLVTLTGNDADGDVDGILVNAAATTNAAASTYEYGFAFDCAENTTGACLDGLLVTSTGASSSLTTGVDVKDSDIVNALEIGSNLILGDNSDSISIGATDNALTVTASTTATAALIFADAAGAADGLIDVAGAGALTFGSADVTAVTITTDATGDGSDLILPENGVNGNEAAIPADSVILCGEHDENGTIYFGPATAPFLGDGSTSYAIGTAACDALDNATENTADVPLTNFPAFKVTGLWCATDATLGAGETIVFTVRSAAADLTPTVTCTIGEAATYCRSVGASTTDVAAGATVAVKAVETSNNGDGDESWCRLYIQMQ